MNPFVGLGSDRRHGQAKVLSLDGGYCAPLQVHSRRSPSRPVRGGRAGLGGLTVHWWTLQHSGASTIARTALAA